MISTLFALILITSCTQIQKTGPKKYAILETSLGKMTIELFTDDAPITCENFIKLTNKGFFNGLIFHRIVKGHVIQSGCPQGDGEGGPGYTIKGEFNSNKHFKGTVGMARDEHPDSAGSQFYICHERRAHLDGKYTVFGHVVEGLDILDTIANVPVIENWIESNGKKIAFHKPKEPVHLKKVTIIEK